MVWFNNLKLNRRGVVQSTVAPEVPRYSPSLKWYPVSSRYA